MRYELALDISMYLIEWCMSLNEQQKIVGMLEECHRDLTHIQSSMDTLESLTKAAFFKVVVIIRLVIKRLFFLDLDEPHQRVHSS